MNGLEKFKAQAKAARESAGNVWIKRVLEYHDVLNKMSRTNNFQDPELRSAFINSERQLEGSAFVVSARQVRKLSTLVPQMADTIDKLCMALERHDEKLKLYLELYYEQKGFSHSHTISEIKRFDEMVARFLSGEDGV